jgi:hypothetical protein
MLLCKCRADLSVEQAVLGVLTVDLQVWGPAAAAMQVISACLQFIQRLHCTVQKRKAFFLACNSTFSFCIPAGLPGLKAGCTVCVFGSLQRCVCDAGVCLACKPGSLVLHIDGGTALLCCQHMCQQIEPLGVFESFGM